MTLEDDLENAIFNITYITAWVGLNPLINLKELIKAHDNAILKIVMLYLKAKWKELKREKRNEKIKE
ncbi:MAG: hypothetical protein ACFFDH_09460 [Promethearchaeota archaeon]